MNILKNKEVITKVNRIIFYIIIVFLYNSCGIRREYYIDFEKLILTSESNSEITEIIFMSTDSINYSSLHLISKVKLVSVSLKLDSLTTFFYTQDKEIKFEPNTNYELIIHPTAGDINETSLYVKTDDKGNICCEGDSSYDNTYIDSSTYKRNSEYY